MRRRTVCARISWIGRADGEGALRIYFHPSRSQIHRVVVRSNEGEILGENTGWDADYRAATVPIKAGFGGNEGMAEIDTTGEVPLIAHADRDSREIHLINPERVLPWSEAFAEISIDEQASGFVPLTTEQLFDVRRKYIDRLGESDPDAARAHGFFYELDWHTEAQLFGKSKAFTAAEIKRRSATIQALTEVLWERIRKRARVWHDAVKQKQEPKVPDEEDLQQPSRAELSYVSILLLGMIRRHFEDNFGRLSVDWVRDAFVQFSTGQLERQTGGLLLNGVPNSPGFFSFGEFALTAIAHGVDQVFWTALCRDLVAPQRFYVEKYYPSFCSKKTRFECRYDYDAFHPASNRYGKVSKPLIEDTQREFFKLDLDGIALREAQVAYEWLHLPPDLWNNETVTA